MGTYNTLETRLKCPRCGAESDMEVDLRFGHTYLFKYHLGDQVKWLPGKAPGNGGRPKGGNTDGEGYTECPVCKKDFFVQVKVRSDTIQGAAPNPKRKAYVPDDP